MIVAIPSNCLKVMVVNITFVAFTMLLNSLPGDDLNLTDQLEVRKQYFHDIFPKVNHTEVQSHSLLPNLKLM